MNPIESVRAYYSLFGCRGVWHAAQARWRQSHTEIAVAVPGIRFPVHLRLRSSDLATFRQVLATAGYDSDFARAPRTIIDAGANIGLTSVFYANRYPEAKILAIEPEESNFRLLKKNTAPYHTIIPLQGALWKNDQELEIVDSGAGEWGFQTKAATPSSPANGRNHGKIVGMTIEMLMQKHGLDGIDFLKMDIEGAEKEVFENAEGWIEKVNLIAAELHDGIAPGCTRAFENATRGFEKVCTRGETVFVARPEYRLREPASPLGVVPRKAADAFRPGQALRCRIVGAAVV
jgi:FkbM family methyltransferase